MTRSRGRPQAGVPGPPLPPDATGFERLTDGALSPVPDKLDQILAAIDFTRSRLETKIGEVAEGLSLLREDHNKLKDRVTTTEHTLKELRPQISQSGSLIEELTDRIRYLEGRAEDSESRARRSNLRLVGLPEGEEGADPVSFIENWLHSIMPAKSLTPFFSIERAHRVPGRRPPLGAPSRPLLAKLLHYKDRDIILQEARRLGSIKLNNYPVMLFPDYTAAIQQQRASFLGVKRKLRELQYKYALLFPARLKIMLDGKSHFFDSPSEAWSWLELREPTISADSATEWRRVSRKKRSPRARRDGKERAGPSRAPTDSQRAKDRSALLQTTAILTQSPSNPPSNPPATPRNSSSDTESSTSCHSITSVSHGPKVTPQTADDIL